MHSSLLVFHLGDMFRVASSSCDSLYVLRYIYMCVCVCVCVCDIKKGVLKRRHYQLLFLQIKFSQIMIFFEYPSIHFANDKTKE